MGMGPIGHLLSHTVMSNGGLPTPVTEVLGQNPWLSRLVEERNRRQDTVELSAESALEEAEEEGQAGEVADKAPQRVASPMKAGEKQGLQPNEDQDDPGVDLLA